MVERSVELARLARPGRAAVLLGGLVAAAVLIGAAVEDVFELGAYLSVTAVFSALLVAAAGALALALRPPPGVAAALVAGFGLLSLEELFLLSDRIMPSRAAVGAVAYAIVVLAAVASFVRALAPLPRSVRPWATAAAAAWGVSVLVVAADPDAGTALRALEELLQMTGASGCIVAAIAALRVSVPAASPGRDAATVVLELVGEVDARRLAIGIAAMIALLGALGTVVIAGWDSRTFDLNTERTLPAYFSAALLLLAAAFTFVLARTARERGLSGLLLVGLAAFFAILGADEVAAVHERAQHRTGVKGQVFMLPLAAFAGLAMLHLIRRLREPLPRLLLVAGAATWGLAQVVDVLHTPGGGGALDYLIVPEETGEMAGSALLALAMLVAVQKVDAPSPAPALPPRTLPGPTLASRH
jgi:hypothetical protein